MEQAESRSWSPLHIAVLIAGGLGILFWLGSMAWWWKIPASHRDGLELIGPVLAAAYLVVLVLPTLILGMMGRWLRFAAVLGCVVVALASDTLFPWIPWS